MSEERPVYDAPPAPGGDYPLQHTASVLNDRLGLYLSPEQQRGLATGLLVGVALGAALVSWTIGNAVRRAL